MSYSSDLLNERLLLFCVRGVLSDYGYTGTLSSLSVRFIIQFSYVGQV